MKNKCYLNEGDSVLENDKEGNSIEIKESDKDNSQRISLNLDKDIWKDFLDFIKNDSSKAAWGKIKKKYVEDALFSYKRMKDKKTSLQFEKIFTDRKKDKTYLRKYYKEALENSEVVKMVGISYRDWLTPESDYFDILKETALTKKVKFKILLLDPLCDAAERRMDIEQPSLDKVKTKRIGYTLFRNILEIVLAYENYPKPLQKAVKIRFSQETPTSYVMSTKDYCFVEIYHSGSIDEVKGVEVSPNDQYAKCLGGYVPYFMLASSSLMSRLMDSHCDNLLARYETNTIHAFKEDLDEKLSLTWDKIKKYLARSSDEEF